MKLYKQIQEIDFPHLSFILLLGRRDLYPQIHGIFINLNSLKKKWHLIESKYINNKKFFLSTILIILFLNINLNY